MMSGLKGLAVETQHRSIVGTKGIHLPRLDWMPFPGAEEERRDG